MAKTKISEFSATANSNTDINSINIAEGCAPSNINDAIRELMAELKDFQAGTKGDSFNGPVGTTTAAAGAFTTLSSTGNTTLGDAVGDTVTINGTATFANANPTLSAGTANGVLYLNGSKVATSGSALQFDGTNFGVGLTPGVPLDVGGAIRSKISGGSPIYYFNDATYQLDIKQSGNALAFDLNGGSEQMRLTSTGLGIGTSSPAAKLDVAGDIIGRATTFRFKDSGNTTQYGAIYADSTTFNINAGVNNLLLYSAGSERARIDSSGNLLVGTTSATGSGKTVINASSTNPSLSLRTPQSSGTIAVQIFFDGDDTDCGSIDVNTTANTTAYTTSSDYRLKENIAPMTGALSTVSQLKPCTWNWKHAPELQGQGFVAHELAEVVPDCVTGEKDAVDAEGNPVYQGIDTSFLVATLTAALQEALAKINSLEARLDAANL